MLLCDRKSKSGQAFLQAYTNVYHHSEYEMVYSRINSKHKGLNVVINGCSEGQLSLRHAKVGEEVLINQMTSDFFKMPFEDLPPIELVSLAKEAMQVMIAEINGIIVGKVNLQLIDGLGGIYGLGIFSKFRGMGYGRSLLDAAVHALKDQGATRIILQVEATNENALNLYFKAGFEVTHTMDYYQYPTT